MARGEPRQRLQLEASKRGSPLDTPTASKATKPGSLVGSFNRRRALAWGRGEGGGGGVVAGGGKDDRRTEHRERAEARRRYEFAGLEPAGLAPAARCRDRDASPLTHHPPGSSPTANKSVSGRDISGQDGEREQLDVNDADQSSLLSTAH